MGTATIVAPNGTPRCRWLSYMFRRTNGLEDFCSPSKRYCIIAADIHIYVVRRLQCGQLDYLRVWNPDCNYTASHSINELDIMASIQPDKNMAFVEDAQRRRAPRGWNVFEHITPLVRDLVGP